MANKELKTRIALKYDFYENWISNNPKLLPGEVALAYIPTDKSVTAGNHTVAGTTPPNILMKVGDGAHTYSELKFVSALAADVNSYAKLSVADFEAQIKTLANTQVSADIQANADAIKALQDLIGSETVTKQISDAITALNLANTYAAKEHTHTKSEITDFAHTHTTSEITDFATEAAKKVDKETGKSLVADTEITKLAGVSEGANKVEASATNGNIKIDGVETTVYTHPEKHAIADVDGLQSALDGKQAAGNYAAEVHTHVKADITDFAHEHTASEITDFATEVAKVKVENATKADEATKATQDGNGKVIAETYAEKATTLAGYGISDAYTKTETEGKITEAINTFTSAYITSDGGAIDKLQEIADWIDSDKNGSADVIADIEANAEAIEAINDANDGILAQAKSYTDGKDTAMNTRVEALEAIDHEHDNKAVLDGITADNVADWNEALDINDITEGTTNGTIRVSISDVPVHGLKALAFKDNTDTLKATEGVAGVVAKMPSGSEVWDNPDATTEQGAFYIQSSEGKRIYLNPEKGTIVTSSSSDMYLGTVVKIEDIADAISKEHEHTNKAVLDGISSEKVTKWDNAFSVEAIDYDEVGILGFNRILHNGTPVNYIGSEGGFLAYSTMENTNTVYNHAGIQHENLNYSFPSASGTLAIAEETATVAQGAKADTAVQTVTADTGLKATKTGTDVSITIDDEVVFIFNCGTSDLEKYEDITA